MRKSAAARATIVIDDSSSSSSDDGWDDGGGSRMSSSSAAAAGSRAHHASTERGRPVHLASLDDDGMDRMINGGGSPLRPSQPPRLASFLHDYQDAVKTALAMAASLAVRPLSGVAEASGAGAGNNNSNNVRTDAVVKTAKKKSEEATRLTKLPNATVDAKARKKRPLVKNSRAWTAAVGKSAEQAESQRPRPVSKSARHHQPNLNTTSSFSTKPTATTPVRSQFEVRSSAQALVKSSSSRTRLEDSTTMMRKVSSGSRHAVARKAPSGSGRSSYGAHESQQRTPGKQPHRQRDVIEISSSSAESSSDDEGGSSGGTSSSSDSSNISSIRSPRSHKVRRVDAQSSFANARGVSATGKARRTSKSAVGGQREKAAYKQKEASAKPTVKQARQSQQSSRHQNESSHRRLPPPLVTARSTPVSKKAMRKTIVLNLSSSSQRTRRDSISSLSSASSSSSDDSSKSQTVYYCKKSAPMPTSSAAVFRVQPAPSQVLPPAPRSFPAFTEEQSSKRQRRQTNARFNVDSVALDEVQAQERELARFEMEKRQRRSFDQASLVAMKRASDHTKPFATWDGGLKAESREVMLAFSDSDSDVQMIEATAARAPARATRKSVVRPVVRLIVKTKQKERPPCSLQQSSPPASVPQADNLLGSLSVRVARKQEERNTLARRRLQTSVKENIAKRAQFFKNLDTSRIVIHPTAYRGISVPRPLVALLLLSEDVSTDCAPPFHSDFDVPLTAFDTTNELEAKCQWLASFGKTKQLMPSLLAYQTEASISQSDMDHQVQELVESELPRLQRCRQRKVNAILVEARSKVAVYKSALGAHQEAVVKAKVQTQRCELPWSEKLVAEHCKKIQVSTGRNGGHVMANFVVACGTTVLQEGHVRRPVLELKKVGTISTSTTCIGVRSNVRVEDDPMVRFSSSSSAAAKSNDGDTRKSDDTCSSSNFQFSASADDEIGEYVLRLVVAELGDSEQVLLSLKNVLGFSQAYTDYMELEKTHRARKLAARRVAEMRELVAAGRVKDESTAKQDNNSNSVATLERLLSFVPMKDNPLATLAERLSPPATFFESHLARSQLAQRQLHKHTSSSSASLGIRAARAGDELSEIYRSLFCRICYSYDCHEHGSEQPQPTRRVDPVHPAMAFQSARMKTNFAEKLAKKRLSFASRAVSDVVGRGDESQVVDLTAPRAEARDPTEYFDTSHVDMVTQAISTFLDPVVGCSTACWKVVAVSDELFAVSDLVPAEIALVQKMRQTVGDSACTIASLLGTVPCAAVGAWLVDGNGGGGGDRGRRGSLGDEQSLRHQQNNWKQKRGARSRNSSHHELLQRARNHRLQEKRTEHQYEPCSHDGLCDSMGCSCMKRDHMCDKACSCSRDCPNRYQGCRCKKGNCGTDACLCFAALRECNPDFCVTCGAPELAITISSFDDAGMSDAPAFCCNMRTLIGHDHRKVALSFSLIHGWGVFAIEDIKSGDFVYEYTGAVVSQDEAERRGSVYDKKSVSFLFDLNEDAVVDAIRSGNKSKFVNHLIVGQNCSAKVVRAVSGHHITIWADRDIKCGEELLFDYGYHGDTAPEWSQDHPGISKKSGDREDLVHK